jgi:hypothetical protein
MSYRRALFHSFPLSLVKRGRRLLGWSSFPPVWPLDGPKEQTPTIRPSPAGCHVGSATTPGTTGIAHLFEHAMFKGHSRDEGLSKDLAIIAAQERSRRNRRGRATMRAVSQGDIDDLLKPENKTRLRVEKESGDLIAQRRPLS